MAEQRLRYLADAGMLLAAAVDLDVTLRQLAVSIVPALADWCTIAVRGEDGVVKRIAAAHADPKLAPVIEEYLHAYVPTAHRASTMVDAIREGRSFYQKHVDPEFLVTSAQDANHLRIIQALGCTSSIIVPLMTRGVSTGALSLSMSGAARSFDEIDHQIARELGTLVGLTIDNARRLGAERTARERAEAAEAETRSLLTERQQLLQSAQTASRAKDEFLAILGHELRNPLAPIVTAIELMKHAGHGAEREVAVIERQTRHLVRLVDDLLDVSRIARGRVELERTHIECADVIAKAIEMAQSLFDKREQRLIVDAPPGLVIDADEARLVQVIANLLTNAAKYTPPHGRIDVRARRSGERISIVVRDSGIGIEPAMLPRIFDMFVQEGQALDRSRGGLGLGLTIVKQLVEAHGGTVSARSDGKGRGSELEIQLPAVTPRVPEQPAPSAAPPANGPDVLVVDDNEDAAELLGETIARWGYRVHTAHDGVAALDVAVAVRPWAAVLDIGLPVMDGYELARRLRELAGDRTLFLIALTGYGQATDRARALAAGFDCHFVKPVGLAAIRTALDAARPASGIPAAP